MICTKLLAIIVGTSVKIGFEVRKPKSWSPNYRVATQIWVGGVTSEDAPLSVGNDGLGRAFPISMTPWSPVRPSLQAMPPPRPRCTQPAPAWSTLLARRSAIRGREGRRLPVPIRPEQRFLLVEQSGNPIAKSSIDSAWQRLIHLALHAGVIEKDERCSLHGLKH
jgi:hypothetical protein